MESKYIELTYDEYVEVYYQYKSVLRHDDIIVRPKSIHWDKIGLEYYDSRAQGKRVFKVLDRDKWMKCWLLIKLSNSKI